MPKKKETETQEAQSERFREAAAAERPMMMHLPPIVRF